MRCKFYLAFCLAIFLFAAADAQDKPKPGETAAPSDNQPKYGQMQECMDCHTGAYNSFLNSVHGKGIDPRTPAAAHACDTCHGPSTEHIDQAEDNAPDKILNSLIIQLGPKTPTAISKQNEICLNCHSTSKTHLLWSGSIHEVRGLGCVNCHLIHGKNPKLLSSPDEILLCGKCHQDVKAQIQMPFHHPIREGKLTCSDCHNPHGSVTDKLISANEINEKCFECHADKRGPFLFEHQPAAENCLNCHTPHGSQHDFLLTARQPWLCQRCHSGEGHQGILYTQNMFPPAVQGNVYKLRPQLYNRGCWQCHVAVHGSNSPSGLTLLR